MSDIYDHLRGYDDAGVTVFPKIGGHRFKAALIAYSQFNVSKVELRDDLGIPAGSQAEADASAIADVLTGKNALGQVAYLHVIEAMHVMVENINDSIVHNSAGQPTLNRTRLNSALEITQP